MQLARKRGRPLLVLLAVLAVTAAACNGGGDSPGAAIIEERGLTVEQVDAALTTYMPTGEWDPYILFASGGHSGQILVIGVPSMRILKVVGVFTPEPWQGWGYGDAKTMDVLAEGAVNGQELTWADTHHPALSETDGDYDGQFVFINDKASARVAVVDLRDFETKQIVKNPTSINDHGGTMVTPNTDWIIEGGQYATPLGWDYAPIPEYAQTYRGMVTFWKFDRASGRILEDQSFAMELPPYWQDLCDAGKLVSDGWVFCNSFNTELATGGILEGGEAFEAGASARDNDYMHVINLVKAAELAAGGSTVDINGFPVIPLQTSIDEGILYFVPEPKSPHGVDVAPGGDYMVVSGKLDPHVTIYSFEKMMAAIDAGNHTPDQFGVPVLDFDASVEAQVEVGLGPLHTQFDNDGYAYTSLFLDSAVARWSLGDPYRSDGWKLEGTIPVHYNIGHLVTAEGDTVEPDGQWLVALNKWSIDRFWHPGPLLPQNFQLVGLDSDVSVNENAGMSLLYDMPIGIGEPHYAQIIKADKMAPFEIYPVPTDAEGNTIGGYDPAIMAVDESAPRRGTEGVVRDGDTVTINMTAIRSTYRPDRVEVRAGDHVIWRITNIEQAIDATHGFSVPGYNINVSIEPGETATVEFDARQDGVFPFYCTEFCSALHLEMAGYFLVEP